jgi:hypothetical protein
MHIFFFRLTGQGQKRKLKENVPADPIIEKTVASLQVLGNRLDEDSAKSPTAKTDVQVC